VQSEGHGLDIRLEVDEKSVVETETAEQETTVKTGSRVRFRTRLRRIFSYTPSAANAAFAVGDEINRGCIPGRKANGDSEWDLTTKVSITLLRCLLHPNSCSLLATS